MTDLEKYVANLTKDIVVAKLSKSAPTNTNKDTGSQIGEMYSAIYNELLKTVESNNIK